jgi:hypothetical protein
VSYKDCLDALQKAAGGTLTDDDMERIVSTIRRRRQQAGSNPLQDEQTLMAQIAKELADEERLAALIEKRSRAINVLRKQQRMDWYSGFEGKEHQGLSILNVGSEKTGEGFGRSVAAEQRALEAKLLGPMLAELRANGLDRLLARRSPEFEQDVARNMWAITEAEVNGTTPKLVGMKEAQEAAKVFTKYQEIARLMQNDAGAWIGKLPGWIVRQSHDMFRIRRAGREAWKQTILPKLDPKTFDGVDNVDEYLNSVWSGLSTGEHYKEKGAQDWLTGFKGPANIAKKASQERSLHFKSADDWFAYNEAFGSSSLLEGVIFGLKRAADNTALMRTWGTNPEAAFLADLTQLKQQASKRGDAKTVEKLNGLLVRSEFDQITGIANIPGRPSWAIIGAGTRAILAMAKLGGAVLSSIPDIAVSAGSLSHNGIRLTEAWGNSLKDVVRGRGNVKEREVADLLAAGIDGFLGSIMSRFSAQDSLPGRMAKLQNRFFRANLLSWWTDSKATGAGLILARNLARNSSKSFDGLDEGLRVSLQRFDIGPKEWAVLSKVDTKVLGDIRYLTPDAVQALPDDVIAPLAKGEGPKAIQRAKDDLEIALRSYYAEEVSNAITMGGARERAMITFGTKPGTGIGEAVRFVMQFKLYPVTFLSRHAGRELHRPSVAGAVHLIVATTALGYLSMTAKELAKGREPRKPETAGDYFKLLGAAMQQGGGLGIYGDFLFGEFNRFGGGLWESNLGPAAGTIGEVFRAFSEFKEGDVKQGGTALARVGLSNAPFLNLFYTKAALDYSVIYQLQEWMSPGYLRRMENRIAKENDQRFIVPPSSAIPYGGGTRVFEGVR